MKKRIGSLLMALVLALSLVPATVWAADGATEVGTFEELKQAVSGEATDIVVTNDIELTERLTVAAGITIRSQEGSVFTLKRSESFTPASDNTDYRFKLDYGADLTFRNIILDGNKEAGQAKNGVFPRERHEGQADPGPGCHHPKLFCHQRRQCHQLGTGQCGHGAGQRY